MPKKKKKNSRSAPSAGGEEDDHHGDGAPASAGCRHAASVVAHHLRRLSPPPHLACQVCSAAPGGRGAKGKGKGKPSQAGRNTEQLWACMRCGLVSCGRYSEGHALAHFEKSHHPLAISLGDFSIWCYECDQEVPPDASKSVKDCVKAARSTLLNEESSSEEEADVVAADAATTKQLASWMVNDKKRHKGTSTDTKAALGSANSGLKGLRNLGNTCFFNSIMQCLTHTRPLREYLRSGQVQLTKDESNENIGSLAITEAILSQEVPNEGPITQALRGFMAAMWAAKGSCVSPQPLFSAIARKAVQFRSYRQQDSQELLRYLLDGLRTEETARLAPPKPEGKKPGESPASSSASPTFVDLIFAGTLESTVTCHQCNSVSKTQEPFFDLSVPLPAQCYPDRSAKGKRRPPSIDVASLPLSGGVAYQKKREPKPLTPKQLKQKAKTERARKRREEKLRLAAAAQVQTTTSDSLDASSPPNPETPATSSVIPSASSSSDGERPASSDPHPIPIQPSADAESSTTRSESAANLQTVTVSEEHTKPQAESPGGEVTGSTSQGSRLDESQETKEPEGGARKQRDGRDEAAIQRWITSEVLREVTLYRCFFEFTQPELLDGENAYRCPECTRARRQAMAREGTGEDEADTDEKAEQEDVVVTTATKQLLIRQPPAILTVHIKRFRQIGGGLAKAGEHCKFPLVLCLAPFVTPPPSSDLEEKREEERSLVYRLYGISVHGGGMGGGHYVAYVFSHEENRWYFFSDSHGREVSIQEVLGAEAYVLFYERIAHPSSSD